MPNSPALFVQSFAQRVEKYPAHTILFLHGGGAAGWMWHPVVDRLPEFHCLVPDLPEQGQSRSTGPFSIQHAADLAAEVIRTQARAGKAVVVGLSEGAQVTVQLLASAPELVEKAVVSSALLKALPGTEAFYSPGLLAWTYRLSVAPFKRSDFWIRLNMKYAAGIPEAYFAQFKKEFQEMTESGFVNFMVANQRFRLPAGLEKFTAPTLVITGAKEYNAMKESARELAAALPRAKAVQISLGKGSSLAAEHNWALTAPDLFARTVRAWITGTPLPEQLTGL
ncbi:MAG: alpha/beta hydrolase [Chloroflexi bacterium]|nr:MAG: alpha/beta hydrolase [Chloroflexota bacterium]